MLLWSGTCHNKVMNTKNWYQEVRLLCGKADHIWWRPLEQSCWKEYEGIWNLELEDPWVLEGLNGPLEWEPGRWCWNMGVEAQLMRYQRGTRTLQGARLRGMFMMGCRRTWLYSASVLRAGVGLNLKVMDSFAWQMQFHDSGVQAASWLLLKGAV